MVNKYYQKKNKENFQKRPHKRYQNFLKKKKKNVRKNLKQI